MAAIATAATAAPPPPLVSSMFTMKLATVVGEAGRGGSCEALQKRRKRLQYATYRVTVDGARLRATASATAIGSAEERCTSAAYSFRSVIEASERHLTLLVAEWREF